MLSQEISEFYLQEFNRGALGTTISEALWLHFLNEHL